jgi:hypothetical protein
LEDTPSGDLGPTAREARRPGGVHGAAEQRHQVCPPPATAGRSPGIPSQDARSVCPVIGVVYAVPTLLPNPAVGSVVLLACLLSARHHAGDAPVPRGRDP